MKDYTVIDGTPYISSSRAAEMTKYSKDYVGQLCREGKVSARFMGRSWYVSQESIIEYKRRADDDLQERSLQYSTHLSQAIGSAKQNEEKGDPLRGERAQGTPPPIEWKVDRSLASASEIPSIRWKFEYASDDRPFLPELDKTRIEPHPSDVESAIRAARDRVPRMMPSVSRMRPRAKSAAAAAAIAIALSFGTAFAMHPEVAARVIASAAESISHVSSLIHTGLASNAQHHRDALSIAPRAANRASVGDVLSSVRSFFTKLFSNGGSNAAPAPAGSTTVPTTPYAYYPYVIPYAATTSESASTAARPSDARPVTVSGYDAGARARLSAVESDLSALGSRIAAAPAASANLAGTLDEARVSELIGMNISNAFRTYSAGNIAVSGGSGSVSSGGTVTSVGASGGGTGLSFSGGPISSSGTLTLGGTLSTAHGGTGMSSAPAYGQVLVGDSAGGYSLVATSSLGISSASAFGYLFPSNATSTLLSLNGGLTAFASSTVGDGTQAGGLTIFGGATTTGNAYVAGTLTSSGYLGIGTTSPQSELEIVGPATHVYLSSPTLNHGMTAWQPTNVAGEITTNNGNGLVIQGISAASGAAGMALNAFNTNPNIPIFLLTGGTRSGSTARGIADSQSLFQLRNYPAIVLNILGNGNIGLGTTSPYSRLGVAGGVVADSYTATSTSIASQFVLASTTGLSVSTLYDSTGSAGPTGYVLQSNGGSATWVATSTLGLGGSGGGSVTSVDASGGTTGLSFSGGPITSSGTFTLGGILATANGGTGLSTAPTYGQLLMGGTSGYGLAATSSLFAGGLTAFASSTVGDGTQAGGLTVSGGATTTGNAYVAGTLTSSGYVGIGTTSPFARLAVNGAISPTGSELVTNGTFTGSAAGWTLGSDATYASNHVVVTYTGGYAQLATNFSTQSGKTYVLTFTVSSADSLVSFYFSNNGQYYSSGPFSNGTYTVAFGTDYTGTETITFFGYNQAIGDTWTLDNVSIKQNSAFPQGAAITGWDGTNWLSIGGDILANTALGKAALSSNTTGYENTAVGMNALTLTTSGRLNAAFGSYALAANTTGLANTAVGDLALVANVSGNNNVAVGSYASLMNGTGGGNIALGKSALKKNVSGNQNIAIGYQAGYDAMGSNNILIGYNADPASTTGSRQLNIGNLIYGTNIGISGSPTSAASAGYVGIGTTTPYQTLSVAGNVVADSYISTSTSLASVFPYASTTMVTSAIASTTRSIVSGSLLISSLAGSGTRCLQVGADGTVSANASACGTGTGAATWSTTTSSVAGEAVNSPLAATDIVAIGGVSTSTAKYWFDPNSMTSRIAYDASDYLTTTLDPTGGAIMKLTGSVGGLTLRNSDLPSASTQFGTNATTSLFVLAGRGADTTYSGASAWGGIGGGISLVGGTGGSPLVSQSSLAQGGTGGAVSISGGSGGNASVNSNLIVGGAGGDLLLSGGTGGSAAGTGSQSGGSGGNVKIYAGSGGSGGSGGSFGNVYLASDGTAAHTGGSIYLGLNSRFRTSNSSFGIGSTTPWAQLSVHAPAGGSLTTLFAIASSTANSTTTLFSVSNTGTAYIAGAVGIGTPSPYAQLAMLGSNSVATTSGSTELVTNGTFATNLSGWTAPVGWSWSSGVALRTGDTWNFDPISQNIAVTAGQTYLMGFTIGGTIGSYVFVYVNGAPMSTVTAVGQYSISFTATTTGSVPIKFVTDAWNGYYNPTLDNVSVKQVSTYTSPTIGLLNSDGTLGLELRSGGSGLNNIFIGANSGYMNVVGYSNTAVGSSTLMHNVTGYNNTAIGDSALTSNTSGYYNTAIGNHALYSSTLASYNTAIGDRALYNANDSGSNNTAVGASALYANTSGTNNVAVGDSVLKANTTGIYNTAVGSGSLQANTTGGDISAFGRSAVQSNTSGQDNSGFGQSSLANNTTGSYNTALGSNAMAYNQVGWANAALGYNALAYMKVSSSTGVGYQAGYNANGSYNLFLGYQAGYGLKSGSGNILIGSNVNPASTTGSQQLNIGNVIFGTGMYNGSTLSASSTSGLIGIGTTTPWRSLSVEGSSDLGVNAYAGSFTATSTTATSTFAGYIDVNGTGDATSTIAANLWVKGNLRTTGNTYTGDLRFKNNFAFTEAPLGAGRLQALLLKNSIGSTTMAIDENGNLSLTGDVCAKNTACMGTSLAALESAMGDLASTTQVLIDAATTTSSITMRGLAAAVDGISANVAALSGTVDGLAAAVASPATTTLEAIASSTSASLESSQTFIEKIADAVRTLLEATGRLVVDSLSSRMVYADRIEAKTVAVSQGIEMADQVTGEAYCVTIRNGDWSRFKGTCAELASTTGALAASQPVAASPSPTVTNVSMPVSAPAVADAPTLTSPSTEAAPTTSMTASAADSSASESASSTSIASTTDLSTTDLSATTTSSNATAIASTTTAVPASTPTAAVSTSTASLASSTSSTSSATSASSASSTSSTSSTSAVSSVSASAPSASATATSTAPAPTAPTTSADQTAAPQAADQTASAGSPSSQ